MFKAWRLTIITKIMTIESSTSWYWFIVSVIHSSVAFGGRSTLRMHSKLNQSERPRENINIWIWVAWTQQFSPSPLTDELAMHILTHASTLTYIVTWSCVFMYTFKSHRRHHTYKTVQAHVAQELLHAVSADMSHPISDNTDEPRTCKTFLPYTQGDFAYWND